MNPRHPPRVFYFSTYQLIMKNLYLSLTLLLGMTLQAQIYQGSASLGTNITLDVTMNTNTDSVDVEISGPSSGYFSVGFGGTGMNGTYIMLVNSNGTVGERKLGQWNGGSALTSSISYSAITSSGTRTAYIERARVGASANHYTFPATGGVFRLSGREEVLPLGITGARIEVLVRSTWLTNVIFQRRR